jgi:cell division septum initiation protein DivIVA
MFMTPTETKAHIDELHMKLNKGVMRMDTFETLIEENRVAHQANAKALAENTEITKEIKAILDLGKSFFIIMGGVAKVAKWVTLIGGAIGVMWAAFHGQVPPKG